MRQAHRDLALDTGFDAVGEAHRAVVTEHRRGLHEPGSRSVQPQILLHPFTGRTNLEAGARHRTNQPRQSQLRSGTVGLRLRRNRTR